LRSVPKKKGSKARARQRVREVARREGGDVMVRAMVMIPAMYRVSETAAQRRKAASKERYAKGRKNRATKGG
jgi:hypothetical protein